MRAAKQTTCTLGATTTATYGRCNTVLHSRSSYHTKHAQSFVLRSAFASHRNKPLSSTRLQGNNTRLFVPSCAVQPQSHLRSKSSTPLSFTKSTLNSILQRSVSVRFHYFSDAQEINCPSRQDINLYGKRKRVK